MNLTPLSSNRRLITTLLRGGIVTAAVVALSSCAGGSDSSDAMDDAVSDTTIAASKGSVGASTSIAVPDSIAPAGPDQALMAQLSDALVGGTTIPEIEVSDGLTLTDVSVSRESDGTIAAAGTANIGSGGLQLTVSASFTDEDNWSLEASGAGLPAWEPEEISGLSVDPNTIAGTISRSDGEVTWDLNGSTLTWTPDGVMSLRAQFGVGTTCPFEDASKCPEGETFLKLIDAQMIMPGVTTENGEPLTVAAVGGIATSGEWARLEASTADLTFEGNGVTDPTMTIWYGERNDSFDPNLEMPDLSSLSQDLNVEFCGGFSISIPKVVNKSTSGCVNWSPVGFAMGQLGGGSSMSGSMPDTDFGSGNLNGSTNIMGVGFTNLSDSVITSLPSPSFVFDQVSTALQNKTFVLGGKTSLPGAVGKAVGVNTDGLTSLVFDVTGSFSATEVKLTGSVPVNIDLGSEPLKMKLTSLQASVTIGRDNGFAFSLGTTADARFGYGDSATDAEMTIALQAVADPIPGVALVANARGTTTENYDGITYATRLRDPGAATYLWTDAFGITGYNLWNLSAQIGFIGGSPALGYNSTAYLDPTRGKMKNLVDCGGTCDSSDYLMSNLIFNVSLTEPCFAYGFDGQASNTALSISKGVFKTTSFKVGMAPNGCTVGEGATAVTLPKAFAGFQFSTRFGGSTLFFATQASADDGFYSKFEATNIKIGPISYPILLFEVSIGTDGTSTTVFKGDMEATAGTFKVESVLTTNSKGLKQTLYAYIDANSGNWKWKGSSNKSNEGYGIRTGDPIFDVDKVEIRSEIEAADTKTSLSFAMTGTIKLRSVTYEIKSASIRFSNGRMEYLDFRFSYTHTPRSYAGKKATADFYLTYDSKKNNFGGGVDTSWTMGWKKTIAGSTFQRDFAIRTSFDFNMNTSTGDTRVTLGGSFKATNVGGGISCVFDTKEPSDIDCKGKYYFEKGAFEKSDTLSGL